MSLKSLQELNVEGKRVLVRVDFNVPMNEAGEITDDSRIRAALPTLAHLLERGTSLTLMSHLGRPKGKPDPQYSLAPVAKRVGELLGRDLPLVVPPAEGNPAKPGAVQLLENLRFYPGETSNDDAFAAQLAGYGDVYVNDAFGAAHRAHASIDAVSNHFAEKGPGLLLMKEIHYLREALAKPARPFVSILGGSKVSDKLKLIGNLLDKVDALIIGGAMSYTFLKAMGIEVGSSRVEEDFLQEAKQLIQDCEQRGVELLLPLDHLTAAEFKADADAAITLDRDIATGQMGLDIGPETIHLFTSKIKNAQTVVWNGPMGVFEWDAFSTGTVAIAEAMAECGGMTVIGGGDSVAAANAAGVEASITHISTGGGASLELLGGNALPGITALER